MTVSPSLPVEIISQPAQLASATRAMAGSWAIALDTESNSLHRYPEQICLIQIATPDKAYIIDTISLKDMDPLKGILADDSVKKIIHGADYDVRCLDRHYRFRIRNLYDTSIAARFSGSTQLGLASLIEEVLGVTIRKSRKLQRTNWGLRPLSADALEYAVADVVHLLDLAQTLDQRLQGLGRDAWAAEECSRLEEVRYTEPDPVNSYLSVKGARHLDGWSLAILKSLFHFREREARRQCRPPFFVLPDTALIYLATSPSATLSEVPGLGQTGVKRFGRGLQQSVREGLTASPVQRPPSVRVQRPSREQGRRLDCLKDWRLSVGAKLSLDPSLLWPTASLERLAMAPDTLDAELVSPEVRGWQRDQFASALRAYLESLA